MSDLVGIQDVGHVDYEGLREPDGVLIVFLQIRQQIWNGLYVKGIEKSIKPITSISKASESVNQ